MNAGIGPNDWGIISANFFCPGTSPASEAMTSTSLPSAAGYKRANGLEPVHERLCVRDLLAA